MEISESESLKRELGNALSRELANRRMATHCRTRLTEEIVRNRKFRQQLEPVYRERKQLREQVQTLRSALSWERGENLEVLALNYRLTVRVGELEKKLAAGDRTELDGTDFAHPAWWRGQEQAMAMFCQHVNDILNGQDDGLGDNVEPWATTRRRLLDLVGRMKGLEK